MLTICLNIQPHYSRLQAIQFHFPLCLWDMGVHVWNKSLLPSCSRPWYHPVCYVASQLHTKRSPAIPQVSVNSRWRTCWIFEVVLTKANISLNWISGITASIGYYPCPFRRFPNQSLSFWGLCVWEHFSVSCISSLSFPRPVPGSSIIPSPPAQNHDFFVKMPPSPQTWLYFLLFSKAIHLVKIPTLLPGEALFWCVFLNKTAAPISPSNAKTAATFSFFL